MMEFKDDVCLMTEIYKKIAKDVCLIMYIFANFVKFNYWKD